MRPELYLSHLFLPLWHSENSSQSLAGSLAVLHHIHQVLSPVDGPLPRLFPRLPVRLSATFFSWMLPPCTSHLTVPVAITLCTGIHHRGHWWTFLFPLCSSTTGIGCDGQRPVICSCECSRPAVFLHKSPMFDLLRVMCEVNLDL